MEGLFHTLTSAATHPETAESTDTSVNWMVAVEAAESKKAINLIVLDLREVTSFTDYFVICSSANPKQAQAIADEVGKRLKGIGELPVSVEGYESAEWVLMDYGDFLVHVFSDTARHYYDLERLWRHASRVEPLVSKS